MTRRRRGLRRRDKRALLVGLALLVPAVLFRAGIAPWMEYRSDLRDTLAAERDALVREQFAIAQAQRDPDRGERYAELLDAAEPWLLGGSTQMAASGALSRLVTQMGSRAGILIQEIQTRDGDETGDGIAPVIVAVRALGDLEGLLRFLHDVENGELLLEVRELTLQTAGRNDGDLERGQLMTAGLVITGLRLDAGDSGDALGSVVTASLGGDR